MKILEPRLGLAAERRIIGECLAKDTPHEGRSRAVIGRRGSVDALEQVRGKTETNWCRHAIKSEAIFRRNQKRATLNEPGVVPDV